METEGWWALFWATGLPVAWLLGRLGETGESVAALAPKEDGGASV